MTTPTHSIVVPVFNEVAALPRLLREIDAAMAPLNVTYECVVVDDGSTDGTATLLDAVAAEPGSPVRPVHFATNRGQGAALYVGLQRARGTTLVTLDGDGQNCPADIPKLLDLLARERLDLVCGIRVARDDSPLRRMMSRLANRVRARVLRDGVRDSGCALKVMRHEVIGALLPLRTLYSFIPALAVSAGFRVGQCAVAHRARDGGQSSYGLRAFLWRPLVDMLGVRWYQGRCVSQRDDMVVAA